jgi:plasmid stabilization system protein ParE
VRVRYSAPAAAELAELLDYIAERSPQGARKVLIRIRQVERHIGRFPKLGSPTHDPLLRAMLTLPYPYVLLYEEQAGEVIVHRVRHAARQR